MENVNNSVQRPSVIEIEDDGHEYQCSQCSFLTRDEKGIETHVKSSHQVKCDMCAKSFDTQVDLNDHETNKHTFEESSNSEETNAQEHLEKCQECGKHFKEEFKPLPST